MRLFSDESSLEVVNKVLDMTAGYYAYRYPFYLQDWQIEVLSEWWDVEISLEERVGGASDLSSTLRDAFENGTGDLGLVAR